jgi:predicted nucleic acid-binding protein
MCRRRKSPHTFFPARAPSIPDILIAATAESNGLTVLHLDKDFELIAQVTGQALERLELMDGVGAGD